MLGQENEQPQRPQPASGTHDLIVGMVTTEFTFVPDAAEKLAGCHSAVGQSVQPDKSVTSVSDKATVANDSRRPKLKDYALSNEATVEEGGRELEQQDYAASNSVKATVGGSSRVLEQEACAASNGDKATVGDSSRKLAQEISATNGNDKGTVEDGVDLTDGAVLLENPDGSLQYVVLTSDEQKAAQQKSQKTAAANVQVSIVVRMSQSVPECMVITIKTFLH